MKQATLLILLLLLSVGGFFLLADTSSTENIPTTSEMIRVAVPASGQVIESPLTITGEARGPWFFEASFSIVLVDSEGITIGETFATAQEDWMTEEFVPFQARLEFVPRPDVINNSATLIFQKQNASDIPELDDSYDVAVHI